MSRLLRNCSLVLLALLALFVLSACSDDSHTRITTGTYAGEAGDAAPYLYVGSLIYEVQISRELNPYNEEDASYLTGLSPAERKLEPGEEWFGVFLQVYNHTKSPQLAATNVTITDTQNNKYIPIVPNQNNQFAYRGGMVPASEQLPALNSVAADGPTEGALLLYKLKVYSLDNRPLEIHIVDPNDPSKTASAELDV